MNTDKSNNINHIKENPKYYIETYGCQMNVYDSELVAGLLQKCGYRETNEINNADAIPVKFNTMAPLGIGTSVIP